MAESSFRLPGNLNVTDGNVSDSFKKWKREYEIYMIATGSDKKDKKVQTAILLHCAGPHILEIYDQFQWAEEGHKNDPEIVLTHLESYCNPRQNEVLESHRFWSVPYQEPFDYFVTDLRKRASSCNFKEADRMIRDKIVFTTTGKLQELLLREDDLNLKKAIQIGRAYEQSKKHVQEFRENPVDVAVNKLNTTNPRSDTQNGPAKQTTGYAKKLVEFKQCGYCGKNHPPKKEKCPAWGKKCSNCGRNNHFQAKCRQEKIYSLESKNTSPDPPNTSHDDEFWLSYVERESRSKLMATMVVNDCNVNFQVDTGAEVNTINQKFVKKSQAKRNSSTLRMWNKSTMTALGETTLSVKNPKTGSTHDVNFFSSSQWFFKVC